MGKTKKKHVKPQYVAKADRKKKPMNKNLKLALIIAPCVLVVALVMFLLLFDDGSLPIKNGAVVTEGDNWIVSNLSDVGTRYYKLGEVVPPEGFTLDVDTHYLSDSNAKDYLYRADDENSQLEQLYFMGVKSKLSELVPSAYTSLGQFFGADQMTEVKSATFSLHPVQYFSSIHTETQEEATNRAAAEAAQAEAEKPAEQEAQGEPSAEATTPPEEPAAETGPITPAQEVPIAVPETSQMIYCYVATVRGASILVEATLKVTEEMPPLDEAGIASLAEELVGYLTLDPFENGK